MKKKKKNKIIRKHEKRCPKQVALIYICIYIHIYIYMSVSLKQTPQRGLRPKATKVPNAKANNANCWGDRVKERGREAEWVKVALLLSGGRQRSARVIWSWHCATYAKRRAANMAQHCHAHKLAPTFNYSIIFINFFAQLYVWECVWGQSEGSAERRSLCASHTRAAGSWQAQKVWAWLWLN